MEDEIREVLQKEFAVPENVEAAKEQAFRQIRQGVHLDSLSKKQVPVPAGRKTGKSRRIYKAMGSVAAAAAVFSAVCIVNPTWAKEIPLIGNVFEKLGNSLGFSGDYSEYAKPVKEEAAAEGTAGETTGTEETGQEPEEGDTAYSKTADGVTVTLSEIYCNDAALYLSLLVESEEPIPDTQMYDEDEKVPYIKLEDTCLNLSYNSNILLTNTYMDGQMVDENTYAGILRVDMQDITYNEEGLAEYYKDLNDFFAEQGLPAGKLESGEISGEEAAAMLGIEELTDEQIASIGGPDYAEYAQPLEVPETFTAELSIGEIVGLRPEETTTIPEIPQELIEEYEQAMADKGLDPDNYESFTEEEMEIEHQLYTEMWKKYAQMYPEVNEIDSEYEYWKYTGGWDFSFQVEKDHTKTQTKELNLLDEEGCGIRSITRTPFEVTMDVYDPAARYCAVALDADGEPMPGPRFGGYADVMAIQDRDVSRMYVYLCDYNEYMDEIKGYYYSDDYEEKKKTRTFKEYLDERAIMHAEVVFDEGK